MLTLPDEIKLRKTRMFLWMILAYSLDGVNSYIESTDQEAYKGEAKYHILIKVLNISTGNCTDNGCTSQWGNHGSCVDFSNSVDFQHLGTTFNLSSGAKPGSVDTTPTEKRTAVTV